MGKKNWINPELKSMVVSNTNTTCDCGATTYRTAKNEHYCHRDNLWHQNNCMSLHQGHDQSAKCPTGGSHEWSGTAHKSSCCCGGSGSNIPSGS